MGQPPPLPLTDTPPPLPLEGKALRRWQLWRGLAICIALGLFLAALSENAVCGDNHCVAGWQPLLFGWFTSFAWYANVLAVWASVALAFGRGAPAMGLAVCALALAQDTYRLDSFAIDMSWNELKFQQVGPGFFYWEACFTALLLGSLPDLLRQLHGWQKRRRWREHLPT